MASRVNRVGHWPIYAHGAVDALRKEGFSEHKIREWCHLWLRSDVREHGGDLALSIWLANTRYKRVIRAAA